MGSLFARVCYQDLQAAHAAACSSVQGFTHSGVDLISSECVSAPTDTTMSICTRLNGGNCVTHSIGWPSMPDCDYSGGAALASEYLSLAMGLLVIVWSGRKLIDLFTISHTE